MRGSRGAVLVESSIIMTASILITMGSISLALIGYQRVSTDVASFYAARAYAMAVGAAGSSASESSADTASATAIANKIAKAMVPGAVTAPETFSNVPFNNAGIGTITDNAYFNQQTRHGGVSLVLPEGRQAYITQSTGGIFSTSNGSGVDVNGVSLEPDMQILNADYDISGDSSYAGSSASNRYFGTAMDVPPYYFSHNYISYCPVLSWTTSCIDTAGTNQTEFLAFGVSSYLTDTNWNAPSVTIAEGDTANPNVFAAMLCHQRVYSYIAQASSNIFPAVRPGYDGSATLLKKGMLESQADKPYDEADIIPPGASWKNYPIQTVYAWDAKIAIGFDVSFSVPEGALPTNPLGGCANVDF